MEKRILGWILIALGLAIIFWVIFSSYEIFTTRSEAPQIFQTVQKEEVLPQKFLSPEEQMQQAFQEKLEEMLPIDFLPRLFNLVAWSIFAMILFFGAGKVAEIGIKLIKLSGA